MMLLAAALIVATSLEGPLFDLSKAESGDIAAWAQFFGAMGAIWFAWRQAGKDGRAREAEAKAAIEAEARQCVINYEIAEDLFRTIVRQQFNASRAIMLNRGKIYFDADIVHYVDSTLSMLDSIVSSPLPNNVCAIDVQQMRHYAYISRARIIMARDRYGHISNERCLKLLVVDLSRHLDYAYMGRNEAGPIVDVDKVRHGRWSWSGGVNLETLHQIYSAAKVPFPGPKNSSSTDADKTQP